MDHVHVNENPSSLQEDHPHETETLDQHDIATIGHDEENVVEELDSNIDPKSEGQTAKEVITPDPAPRRSSSVPRLFIKYMIPWANWLEQLRKACTTISSITTL